MSFVPAGELLHRIAIGPVVVHGVPGIRVAHGQAAEQPPVIRDPEQFPHQAGIVGHRGLRTALQSLLAGGQHDALDEHAHVEPGSDLHGAVDEEEERQGRAEEAVVVLPGLQAALLVLPLDPQGLVERHAALEAAALVGLHPLLGVVLVVGRGLFTGLHGGEKAFDQPRLGIPLDDGHLPRLRVGAGRAPAGRVQDLPDHLPLHRPVEIGAAGVAPRDGFFHVHQRYTLRLKRSVRRLTTRSMKSTPSR